MKTTCRSHSIIEIKFEKKNMDHTGSLRDHCTQRMDHIYEIIEMSLLHMNHRETSKTMENDTYRAKANYEKWAGLNQHYVNETFSDILIHFF